MAYTFKHGDRPIEGYTIQRAVGRGGFGEVYYAISDGGREVALKYLRDNPQVELRGVGHCINLKSPHLVSIFDVRKTHDGEYVIIMEYCSGPSLRDLLIAEPHGFEPQKAAFFVREIGKGLSYLHDRGIVHRDLKPGNVFYDDGYVKIGDYGLSKFISISRHSGQTASVGTVHYMAPEIGSGNYSRGVDIYALGVILYEMLLGKVPFEGSSMGEVLMKHLTTQAEVDHLPAPFANVIRKALQKDPNDRYATVDEMVTEIVDVDSVRESLAGFSLRSLEGAVHGGAHVESPVPSPNPVPTRAVPPPVPGRQGGAPFAMPVPGALPRKLEKRIERISRKVDAKVAKLGGGRRAKHGGKPRRAPAREGEQGTHAVAAGTSRDADLAPGARRKRMFLSGIMSLGLAIGLGILMGSASGVEEVGAAAGLLVAGLSGGIVLSRRVVDWFGVAFGPTWSQRLIYGACCAPLLGIGVAPLVDMRDSEGGAVWLGLMAVAVLCKWDRVYEDATGGEMRFGCALGKAFAGLCYTFLAGLVVVGEPEEYVLVGAGVAGAACLIIQTTAWWQRSGRPAAMTHGGSAPPVAGGVEQPSPDAEHSTWAGGDEGVAGRGAARAEPLAYGTTYLELDEGSDAALLKSSGTRHASGARPRWGITRAFWGLVAFALMGGTIVTFLIPLVGHFSYHEQTQAIVMCVGFAAFTVFALRKLDPVKRDGFWRESIRPFLLSAAMFGIGATITGIAREWDHFCGPAELRSHCLADEGRIALLAGLIMCSLLFLLLVAFTGRRRKPRPFLPGDGAAAYAGSAAPSEAMGRPDVKPGTP